MRLKYTFDKMELNDQIVAVPVGDNADNYHGVVKMNETANAIFNLLAEDTTEEAIVEAMEKEYDLSKEILADDVMHYVQEFREKGMLVE